VYAAPGVSFIPVAWLQGCILFTSTVLGPQVVPLSKQHNCCWKLPWRKCKSGKQMQIEVRRTSSGGLLLLTNVLNGIEFLPTRGLYLKQYFKISDIYESFREFYKLFIYKDKDDNDNGKNDTIIIITATTTIIAVRFSYTVCLVVLM
jgi:hypothetical protein